jgi:Na+/melibiose symporter-like transporter
MSGADGYLPLEDGTEAKQSKQCNGVTSETMSFFHKLSYSIGHFYNDLIAACWFTYLLVALKAQRMSPTDAGIALLVVCRQCECVCVCVCVWVSE